MKNLKIELIVKTVLYFIIYKYIVYYNIPITILQVYTQYT